MLKKNILKYMKNSNKLYFFLKYGNLSASVRNRFLKYFLILKKDFKININILFDNYYFEQRIINNNFVLLNILTSFVKRFFQVLFVKNHSRVIVQGELYPYTPNFLERLLIIKKCKIIYDLDDAIFHKYDQSNFLLKHKFKFLFRNSHKVIVGSNYLKNKVKKLGAKNVKLIPTSIDLKNFKTVHKKKNKKFTIVWIGSPSTTCYLNLIADILNHFQNKENSRVILIGADQNKIITKNNFEFYKWSPLNEVNLLKKSHIGVMPLLNNKWEKGKCGFKILQYFSSQIPALVSPVGENKFIVDNYKNGFFAKNKNDWYKYLYLAKKNSVLIRKMGLNGYKKIKKLYSIDQNKYIFKEFITK